MATLAQMRTAIVDALGAAVPTAKRVQSHHGELDATELRKVGQGTPAILVVCLGISSVDLRGSVPSANVRWGAFVLTQRARGGLREDEALAIVQRLVQVLPFQRWDLEAAGRVSELRAESLYGSELDTQGVSTWLVSWYQALDLDPEADAAELDDFLTFVAEHDLAPADGDGEATDHVPLEAS